MALTTSHRHLLNPSGNIHKHENTKRTYTDKEDALAEPEQIFNMQEINCKTIDEWWLALNDWTVIVLIVYNITNLDLLYFFL